MGQTGSAYHAPFWPVFLSFMMTRIGKIIISRLENCRFCCNVNGIWLCKRRVKEFSSWYKSLPLNKTECGKSLPTASQSCSSSAIRSTPNPYRRNLDAVSHRHADAVEQRLIEQSSRQNVNSLNDQRLRSSGFCFRRAEYFSEPSNLVFSATHRGIR